MYRAVLEIPCDDREILKKVLEPEKDGDEFYSSLRIENGKLIIEIEADRISMLQAGVNSYLRLIKSIC